MPKLKKIKPKKTTLTAEERYWQQTELASKKLIADCLQHNLPSNNLENSTDWRVIAREDIPRSYEDEEELPDIQDLAQQISYHYLLTIIQGFLNDLRDYNCHDESYFQQLIQG